MSDRFEKLMKIPQQPAARLLALANARLGVKLAAPASAPVDEVLRELAAKNAVVDMLRLLSVSLPPRERVWWACLAARDLVTASMAPPKIVETVEAWVFEPNDSNLVQVRRAVDLADDEDETVLCGKTALMAGGKLGPEELAGMDAPPGASSAFALIMNARSLMHDPEKAETQGQLLIERALDIARGGQGDVKAPPPPVFDKPAPKGAVSPKAPRQRPGQ